MKTKVIPTSRLPPTCVRWRRPDQGKLKLNIDGSAQGNSGLAGGGGVLRDNQGNWVLGYSRKIERTTSFLAELWALRDGLHLCLSNNHLDVEVELDAKIIVDSNQTSQYLPSCSWLLDSTTFSSSTATAKETSALMDSLERVSCRLMIFSSMITPLWS